MAPPTGPRAGANAKSSRNTRDTTANRGGARGGSRGGIAKRGRSSAVKIDRDGDLDMDTAAAGTRSGSGASKPLDRTARRGARASAPSKATSRLQQNITRHLGGDISQTPRATRVSGNNTTLKVLGLKASRAASNADGGVRSLLEFLEKKATHVKTTGSERGRRVRPVAIKKVCQGIRSWVREGTQRQQRSNLVIMPCFSQNEQTIASAIAASTFPVNPVHHSRFLLTLLTSP